VASARARPGSAWRRELGDRTARPNRAALTRTPDTVARGDRRYGPPGRQRRSTLRCTPPRSRAARRHRP
jgi:hypothetical protein